MRFHLLRLLVRIEVQSYELKLKIDSCYAKKIVLKKCQNIFVSSIKISIFAQYMKSMKDMERKGIICVIVVVVALIVTSCKIQNAPGAYQCAKGRVTVEELQKQNENKPEVAPAPTPVGRQTEVVQEEKQQEVVEEPTFVPAPVVVVPTPEVEVEKEVTRAEKFEVVEGQTNVVLKKYHVVIGSFGNKDNALRLQAEMRPGYEPILVQNDKGMYRVLLMTYDTYKEAKVKIAEIKDKFPDAWVLIRE